MDRVIDDLYQKSTRSIHSIRLSTVPQILFLKREDLESKQELDGRKGDRGREEEGREGEKGLVEGVLF